MQAQKEAPPDMQCKDTFLLQSVVASTGVTAKDITPEMFSKEAGHVVEEYKLRVVYVSPPQPPSLVPEGSEEGSTPKSSLLDNMSRSNSEVSQSFVDSYDHSSEWGENLELMYDRILRYPDRVRNLYFTFLFVLRAVTKASDYLEQAEYDSGNHAEDVKAQSLMHQLLNNPKLQATCPLPFDEAKLWQGQNGPELKQQIQKQFRNIRFFPSNFCAIGVTATVAQK